MSETKYFPTTEAIDNAAAVLSEILEPTPFMKNNHLSDIYDAEVYGPKVNIGDILDYVACNAAMNILNLADISASGNICIRGETLDINEYCTND